MLTSDAWIKGRVCSPPGLNLHCVSCLRPDSLTSISLPQEDKMVDHIIPAGAFFTYSPQIHISKDPAVDDTVREAIIWTEKRSEKGGEMNCQLRPGSDKERDGHLARIVGVRKMHAMLLELNGKTIYKLTWHGKVSPCLFQYVKMQSSLRYSCRRKNGLFQ